MSEALKSYLSMVKNITEPMKELQEIAREQPQITVLQDLVATGSAISTTAAGLEQTGYVNSASLYDSTLNVQTLSENVLTSMKTEGILIVARESKRTASEIRSKLDFQQSNAHLFDYYKDISDLAVVTKSIEEVCLQLSRSQKPESLWSLIKNWFIDVKSRVEAVVTRLTTVFGRIGQELASALTGIEATIEKAVSEFAKKLKIFVAKVHEFALSLIRKMFNFVGEIQKIAQEYKWNIKEISVEIPSCEVEVFTVVGFPIPVPKISTPKLAIAFAPTGS